jgi:hypothetical protein
MGLAGIERFVIVSLEFVFPSLSRILLGDRIEPKVVLRNWKEDGAGHYGVTCRVSRTFGRFREQYSYSERPRNLGRMIVK